MDELNSPAKTTPDATESGFSETKQHDGSFSYNEATIDMPESSEATIKRVLSSYAIGQKLRQLRLKKKIALVDLGKHTGLSASMLSQLENGKLMPTLPTLARIAMVFDVGLDFFFGDKKRKRPFIAVRSDERMVFPDRPGNPTPVYMFEVLAFSSHDKSMQAYLAEFPKKLPNELEEHTHDGAEFIHVLEGAIVVRYSGEEHTLHAGDSVYFDSSEPHGYRGASRQAAKAIVVTTPPRI